MRIVISGTVGVGKSTISSLLAKKLKNKSYNIFYLKEETINSIYLDYYYQSPQNWAFIAQLDFLLERFKQLLVNEKRIKLLDPKKIKKDITIYDRHFLDDYIFAELNAIKNNISMFNSLTYQVIYKEMLSKMSQMDAKPDYFILLHAPIETVLNRMRSRGRSIEINTPEDYWKDLYYNYYNREMCKNHFQQNVKNLINIDTQNRTPEEIVSEILTKIKI
ncbi:MAG: AAA family ATPase [Mycoplasmataceae bacterium]|nr:AAA family ATPase [Mycoplasmataceae bacterium]